MIDNMLYKAYVSTPTSPIISPKASFKNLHKLCNYETSKQVQADFDPLIYQKSGLSYDSSEGEEAFMTAKIKSRETSQTMLRVPHSRLYYAGTV